MNLTCYGSWKKMQSTDSERKFTHLILYSLEKEKCIN